MRPPKHRLVSHTHIHSHILSHAVTHSHSQSHSLTYIHSHSHSDTHTLARIHTFSHVLIHTQYVCIHMLSHTRTLVHSLTHSLAHSCTHTHSCTPTRTLTQSHTRTPSRASIAPMMKILSLQEPAPPTPSGPCCLFCNPPTLCSSDTSQLSAPITGLCTGCSLICSTHTHLLPSPPATKHSSAPALIPVRSPS